MAISLEFKWIENVGPQVGVRTNYEIMKLLLWNYEIIIMKSWNYYYEIMKLLLWNYDYEIIIMKLWLWNYYYEIMIMKFLKFELRYFNFKKANKANIDI